MRPAETVPTPGLRLPLIALFGALALSNAFLSYIHAPLRYQGLVFLFGILLPLYVAFRNEPPAPEPDSRRGIPSAVWILLAAAVFLTRFLFLTTYRSFPGGDEGLHGFLAQGLVPHWNWTFFYTCAEHPPLLIWSLAGLMRLLHDSLLSLYLVPAIASTLGWIFLSAAGARLFPRWKAVLFSFLLALSFWPLHTSRFCHQGPMVLPFLGAAVYGFARLKDASGRARILWALWTGLALGAGTLTFTAFLAALPPAVAFFLWFAWRGREEHPPRPLLLAFFAGLLAGTALFLVAVVREGYGQHLYSVSALGSWSGAVQGRLVGLSYVTALFWGGWVPTGPYGPPGGGLLNPLLGAACLLGLVVALRRLPRSGAAWPLVFTLFALLPGVLSTDYVEMFRVILVQPLLVYFVCLGCEALRDSLPGPRWARAFYLLLALSTLLDLGWWAAPLFRRGADSPGPSESAYRLLKDETNRNGPGDLLTDFSPLERNHALSCSVFDLNAAVNPRLQNAQPAWVGLVTQADYLPFLRREFPTARWFSFPGAPGDPPCAVGLLSLRGEFRERLERWVAVHAFFHRQQLMVENVFASRRNYAEATRQVAEGAEIVRGDRFLETAYGEWGAQYYWDPGQTRNEWFLEGAVERGYPVPRLMEIVKRMKALHTPKKR